MRPMAYQHAKNYVIVFLNHSIFNRKGDTGMTFSFTGAVNVSFPKAMAEEWKNITEDPKPIRTNFFSMCLYKTQPHD